MFREKDDTVVVDYYAVEVYLPYDYMGKSYRGYEYYSIVGSHVRFFAVGMMRTFNSKQEYEKDHNTLPCYPLGIPMLITSAPSQIDVMNVQFSKTGPIRKCVVLTYFKNDLFMTTRQSIKSSNNVMIIMNQLESGKYDFFPPEAMVTLLQDAQSMNNVKLRIPTEEEEIFVAERYRDPSKKYQKARFSENPDTDQLASYNLRQESMDMSTYQAWTSEDINKSLVVSANRAEAGISDEPTIMEMIVTGQDMFGVAEARDERLRQQEKLNQTSKKDTQG